MKNNVSFQSLGLRPEILASIQQKGFSLPTDIQKKIIPRLLKERHDIMGIAQTGSGKTASFALPILDQGQLQNGKPMALIITPTRELALQVTEEIRSLAPEPTIAIATLYGGTSIHTQLKQLAKGTDILVGTPGRLCDLLQRKALDLSKLQYMVIDEADEMLKMGFIEDIERLLAVTPEKKRTLLLSATMPREIEALSQKYMHKPEIIKVASTIALKQNITQQYMVIKKSQRDEVLHHILATTPHFYGIVFAATKREVIALTQALQQWGYLADCLHGDMAQNQREKVLTALRNHKVKILVATDVAARGLDVEGLSHVVNHSLPQDNDTYVHRVGRTGRAGKSGVALTFISDSQRFIIKKIEKLTQNPFVRLQPPTVAARQEIQWQKIETSITQRLQGEKKLPYLHQSQALLKKFQPDQLVALWLEELFPSASVEKKSETPKRKRASRTASSKKSFSSKRNQGKKPNRSGRRRK